MNKILIVAGLSGMLMPALASAELNYNIADVGFTSKISRATANFTELRVGVSKSVSKNLYLDASFQAGTQRTSVNANNNRLHTTSVGAGFHTPLPQLNDNADVIAAGHIFQGTDQVPGSAANAHGYDMGAGVRAQFPYGLEGDIVAIYYSTSNATYSSKDTYVNAQLGFDFTPNIQWYAGIDLWRSDQTLNFGIRVFY
jgi:hypothetical protein